MTERTDVPKSTSFKRASIEKAAARVTPILCSRVEAAVMLGIGTTKADELIADGKLESVLIGQRRMVKISSIRRLAGEAEPAEREHEAA